MRLEARSVALAIAAVACAIACIVGAACIIAPPPELPKGPERPPRILRSSARPAPDAPMIQWPQEFVVSVDPENPDNPSAPPSYYVYVDPNDPDPMRGPLNLPGQGQSPNDAGLSLIEFTINPQDPNRPIDTSSCHHIELVVARSFTNFLADPPGPDILIWTYGGPNAPYAPYGCAWSPLDGQAPPSDAADGPFIPPSDGGGVDP